MNNPRQDAAHADATQQDDPQQKSTELQPQNPHNSPSEPITEAIPNSAEQSVKPTEHRDETQRLFNRRWRGYDRDQVEEYLTFLRLHNDELVSRLAELDAARHRHAARADRAEQQARTANSALAEHRRNSESRQQQQHSEHNEDQQHYQEFTRRLQKLLRVAADDAEQIRADARREAQQHRDAVEAELSTLRQARDELRDQLSRLHDLLAKQLKPPTPPQPRPSPEPGPTLTATTTKLNPAAARDPAADTG